MNARSAVVVTGVLLALAACGEDRPKRLAPPVPVHGTLRLVTPAGAAPLAGTVTFDGDGATWSVLADSHGSFKVWLSPGSFRVSATSPRYGAGHDTCRLAHEVKVTAATPPITVTCRLP